MSSNAPLNAQEFSTYSKVSLGWLSPKIIRQGEATSAYLGAYNFISETEREDRANYNGPVAVSENIDGKDFKFDIVSQVPGLDEAVYRSLIVLTEPSAEAVKVTEPNSRSGKKSAYSGRFDGESRALSLSFKVPEEGDAVVSFDTLYHIETETNFLAQGEDQTDIKVTVDYDLGEVKINGKVIESLRLVSGDDNFDSLNEQLADCKVDEVLALRARNVHNQLSEEESTRFGELAEACQKPSWVTKKYDLSAYRGQEVSFQIAYTTDAGYTEIGIVIDNLKTPADKIDFETAAEDKDIPGQEFKLLVDGQYNIFHNQFYLMEYRTPGEDFMQNGKALSYNMDNNIVQGEQSMFVDEGADLRERFRLIEFKYQPGVLVWYFNSKFGRTDNNPAGTKGKGYLLVLNSKVKEVPLPGLLGAEELFNADGFYDSKATAYKELVKEQDDFFVCFSHTSFYRYTNGEDAKCDETHTVDALQKLTMNGKSLIYRREGFNQILPERRVGFHSVGNPMRRGSTMRTGLSTFRPAGAANFAPFKVYKEHYGEMVIDQALTASAPNFPAVSSFNDADNELAEQDDLRGDSVVVEKKGFSFEVVEPSARAVSRYSKQAHADHSANYFRRPRAKIYFNWK
jgi:hypothetical protein